MKKVLFLDIDGVLHALAEAGSKANHFEWLPHLVELVADQPELGIVVHSSWRFVFDARELSRLLGPLGDRVLGVTPPGPRYESILEWLSLNPDLDYLILDDDPLEFPSPAPTELLLCDPALGVSCATTRERIRRWLEGSTQA